MYFQLVFLLCLFFCINISFAQEKITSDINATVIASQKNDSSISFYKLNVEQKIDVKNFSKDSIRCEYKNNNLNIFGGLFIEDIDISNLIVIYSPDNKLYSDTIKLQNYYGTSFTIPTKDTSFNLTLKYNYVEKLHCFYF